MLTVHGNLSRNILLPAEQDLFDKGELVVRGNVYEGSRLFASFQPDQFTTGRLLNNFAILNKREPFARWMSQTLWVAKKMAKQ
jgi:hypothetical protein